MAAADIFALFPWLRELGFTDIVNDMLADDIEDPTAILSGIRRSARHAEIFPGMIGIDGVLLVPDEATYRATMTDYRTVLRNANLDPDSYSDADLARFLDADVRVDPNELADRFDVYNDLKRSGRHVRDAFYVYGGISMSDDELYSYVVDPNARRKFDEDYAQQIATNSPDYNTFITRATQAGLDAVATSLRDLEEDGIAVAFASSTVSQIDPEFARQMTDLLYQGGDLTQTLGLDELTAALEFALIGGAATGAGLALPDADRIAEIRAAGIDRNRALQAYGTFATQQDLLAGQVQRLNLGKRRFTQSDFEEAVFLQDAESTDLLARAAAREASLGRAQGSAGFSQTGSGRLVQSGFRAPFT